MGTKEKNWVWRLEDLDILKNIKKDLIIQLNSKDINVDQNFIHSTKNILSYDFNNIEHEILFSIFCLSISLNLQQFKLFISSLVNTIILIYTGAALPLLLLFMDKSQSFLSIINIETLSEEIVRTLIGSIALVLAVPITTIIAVYYFDKKKKWCGCPHRACWLPSPFNKYLFTKAC